MAEHHFAISSESISTAKRYGLGIDLKSKAQVFVVEVEVDNTTVDLGVLFKDDLRELASQMRAAANYIDPQEDNS